MHVDVPDEYFRVLKTNFVLIRLLDIEIVFQPKVVNIIFNLRLTPVSYTHLDVYKRQCLYNVM